MLSGADSGGVLDLSAILSLLKIPSVLFIVVLKAAVGVPAGVFHAMFTMVNLERFELTPESNGRLLSYVGVLTMVTTPPTQCVCSNYIGCVDHARLWCGLLLQEIE